MSFLCNRGYLIEESSALADTINEMSAAEREESEQRAALAERSEAEELRSSTGRYLSPNVPVERESMQMVGCMYLQRA